MNVWFTKYCSHEKLSYSKHGISTGSPKVLCKIHDYEYNQTTSASPAATVTNNTTDNWIVRKIHFISK